MTEAPTHSLAAHSKRARVAGVDTFWLESGTGPAVVLLHGLGASSYSWRLIFSSLTPSHRVIAVDLPGFGRSEARDDLDYSLIGQSRWLCAFLDHLGLERAHLVGNSMGGVISIVTAMDSPARAGKLGLLGAPAYVGDQPALLWPLRWPVVGRLYESLLGPTAVRLIGRTAFKDPSYLTEDAIAEYSLSLRTPQGRRATAQFLRVAIPPDAKERMARYPTLSHEILMIRGDHDGVLPSKSARRFCSEVPRARLLEIADCGHAPQEEKPAAVSSALLAFFA